MTAITATVQAFFTERLLTQRHASPRTVPCASRETDRRSGRCGHRRRWRW